MASTTVKPNGDGTNSGVLKKLVVGTPLWEEIDDGTDPTPATTDYVLGDPGDHFFVELEAMPGDFDEGTAIDVVVSASQGVALSPNIEKLSFQLFEENETTPITSVSSLVSIIGTGQAEYSATLTITGATDQATWDAARLKIVFDSGGDDTIKIYALDADITYDVAVSSPIDPAGSIIVANGNGTGTTNYADYANGILTPNDGLLADISGNFTWYFLLENMPSDFVSMLEISVSARLKLSAGADPTTLNVSIVESDESTAITGESGVFSPTTTIGNYTLPLTITGTNNKTKWDGAVAKLEFVYSSGANIQFYEIQFNINYGYKQDVIIMKTIAIPPPEMLNWA